MRSVPWYRRAAADLLIRLWDSQNALSYHWRQRRMREQSLRTFCEENGLEPPPDSARKMHAFYRRYQRNNAAILVGGLLDDMTKVDGVYRRFHFIGREILESYRNRGAILVSFHLGPYSMIPPMLTRMNFNVTILARADDIGAASKHSMSDINRMLSDRLSRNGMGIAQFIDSLGMLSLIQIKKALNRKDFLMIYADTIKSSSVSWAPVPFFRQKIAGHLGLAKLLQMTGADVLHLYTYWDERDRMVMEIQGPRPYRADASAEELLALLYGPLQGLVAKRLPQWTHIHSYQELKYDYPLPPPSAL